MEHDGGEGAVLTRIVTLAGTGSTNADLLDLARDHAAEEGLWLRAERQTGGRGRRGRVWVSPPGNLYASTLVRVRDGEPSAPTLALMAGVAVWESVAAVLNDDGLRIKWPNDLLLNGDKLGGILLERTGDAVVIGCGVNVASHPDLAERPTTSLAANGVKTDAAALLDRLAERFAHWLAIWRMALTPIIARWLALAHPIDAPLAVHLPDGTRVDGGFGGLDADGALILRLAGGTSRVIHAGDVFLV